MKIRRRTKMSLNSSRADEVDGERHEREAG